MTKTSAVNRLMDPLRDGMLDLEGLVEEYLGTTGFPRFTAARKAERSRRPRSSVDSMPAPSALDSVDDLLLEALAGFGDDFFEN